MVKYVCEGCGYESDQPGKCPDCGIGLKEEEKEEIEEVQKA